MGAADPNNDVLIICDHAVNDLKFMKVTDPEQGLIRSFEAYDQGSADLASSLSERLECLGVFANFSKIVIDPSLPICNLELVRTHYKSEDLPISINASGYRLWERLSDFYLEYQKILREVMVFIDPKIIISIHTHE